MKSLPWLEMKDMIAGLLANIRDALRRGVAV
jgi:hypothetical protein